MSALGSMGRWANQLFQFATLRACAERVGAAVAVPPWAGDQIFDLPPPAQLAALPLLHERNLPDGHPFPPDPAEMVGRDWAGYGQFHTSWWGADGRALWERTFRPRPEVEERLVPALGKLRARGHVVVGIHIRRGDYGRHLDSPFYVTPVEWYVTALRGLRPALKSPAVFIATEDRALVKAFSEWNPATVADLGVEAAKPLRGYNYLPEEEAAADPRQLDFYTDFWLLSKCDVLLIPNSTFSFAAAMLSGGARTLRSSLDLRGFEEVDPWSSHPLMRRTIREAGDVPGIRAGA